MSAERDARKTLIHVRVLLGKVTEAVHRQKRGYSLSTLEKFYIKHYDANQLSLAAKAAELCLNQLEPKEKR